jgi:alginate O-acetyltransferase complex protein AlgI
VVFSSPRFLIFLVAVLIVLRPMFPLPAKKWILAFASSIFYAAWDYRYLALLLAVSVIDYYCAARIAKSERIGVRRFWLWASIISNLSILGYFKYAGFFISNMNGILAPWGRSLPYLHVLLPAGISFYTFKSMSYTIDVYRREIEPCKSQLDYTMFVTFFPELIAGPIVRASVFLPQMGRQIGANSERLRVGSSLFLLGLTKKLLIADRVAGIADPIFAAPQLYSGATLWAAVIAYTIQIYCDFSGYSDMAIGTAKMIGYDLPENFNMPYAATSITEFWRRWHMTLSAWLRDYLYIPLGGNRRGPLRTYVNLFITMLLGGLWHGASWNFVLWGGLHGTALGVHKAYRSRFPRFAMPSWIAQPLTLVFVMLCWIPFRAPDFRSTIDILTGMLTLRHGAIWYPVILPAIVALVIAGHILGTMIARSASSPDSTVSRLLRAIDAETLRDEISGWYVRLGTSNVAGAFVVSFWVMFVFFFAAASSAPFIYFQF